MTPAMVAPGIMTAVIRQNYRPGEGTARLIYFRWGREPPFVLVLVLVVVLD